MDGKRFSLVASLRDIVVLAFARCRKRILRDLRLKAWDGAPHREAVTDGASLNPRASPCRGIALSPSPPRLAIGRY
ncbi:hypothetical protein CHELA1G11_11305 [Hyphomicrobiales bacterium]|nr:hypothetical protein CHELA1G11_11305 [Hyphomicrobiales bacterium]CAH1668697.1 hypothetical protein CHELA1G2_13004 [Hyphomicrobiales bacterium]